MARPAKFYPALAATPSLGILPAMIRPIWKFMLVALAGWMNRQQQEAIEFLRVENRILREKPGQKRIRLNDSQRPRPTSVASLGSRRVTSRASRNPNRLSLAPGRKGPGCLSAPNDQEAHRVHWSAGPSSAPSLPVNFYTFAGGSLLYQLPSKKRQRYGTGHICCCGPRRARRVQRHDTAMS